MAEDNIPSKQIKIEFVDEANLPILFANAVNVRAGLEEFYLTFGTALPIEVKSTEDLEKIEKIAAKPLFCLAITKTVMKQMIDLMNDVYNQQIQAFDSASQQLEAQEEGE